jgi:hypothetical protein
MFNMVKTKKTISFLLVALFVSYHAGTTFFVHSHSISGATIFHSHFHTATHHDTQSGGHTEYCITLIAQISQFQYIDFSCGTVPTPVQFSLHTTNFVETTHFVAPIYLENLSLRAPPVQA